MTGRDECFPDQNLIQIFSLAHEESRIPRLHALEKRWPAMQDARQAVNFQHIRQA
jgi:hypothetical protein